MNTEGKNILGQEDFWNVLAMSSDVPRRPPQNLRDPTDADVKAFEEHANTAWLEVATPGWTFSGR